MLGWLRDALNTSLTPADDWGALTVAEYGLLLAGLASLITVAVVAFGGV